ncbi:MAG: hypothetical protein QM817_10340 [Archangium sp.]
MATPPDDWTEEPVDAVPPGWTEEPVTPEAQQPASAATTSVPALDQFRAKAGLSYPWAAAERQAAADRQAENELLRRAARDAFDSNETDDVATARAQAVLGVPFSQVRKALPAWRKAAALQEFDPDRLDPALRELLLKRPEATGVTLKTNEAGHIVQAIRAITDWATDAFNADLERQTEEERGTPRERDRQFLKDALVTLNAPFVGEEKARAEAHDLLEPRTPAEQAQTTADRTKRDAPTQSLAVDNEEAAALRESGRLAQLAQQYRQAKAGLELSRMQTQLMRVENGLEPGEPAELRAAIADAKLKLPLLLENDSISADLDAVAQGAASSLDVMSEAGKGAGVVGLGTAALAGLATLATTRSPTAARTAALAGARAGAGVGARAGAFYASAELETGSSYEELRDLRTDDGKYLTPGEAMGGAVVLGLLKATVEVATLGEQTDLIRKSLPGGLTGLKSALASDPTLRALVARVGKDYAKSVASEGGEEVVQDALEQLGSYLFASAKDGKLQARAVYDVQRGVHALEGGLLGGLGLGGATSVGTLALRGVQLQQRAHDATVAPKQAAAVLELAKHNLAAVAPADAADLVTQLSSEGGGVPVTGLHVPAAAVLRFFQDNGANPDESQRYFDAILGGGAYENVRQVAEMPGARIEVPLGLVMEKWGRSAIGQALAGDTSTTATGATLREANERGATFDGPDFRDAVEAVQRLAQEEEDVTGIDTQLADLEEQLVKIKRTTRAEARQTIALLQHFIQTQAQDTGVHPADLLARFKLEFHQGSEKSMAEMAAESSGEPTTRIEQAKPPRRPRKPVVTGPFRTGLNADEEAAVAADAEWMQQFGLNRAESIARARLAVRKFRPSLNAAEKLANTRKDVLAAEKTSKARLAERQKASLALLDFIEGKGAGIVAKGSSLEKRRAEAGALVIDAELEQEVKDLLRQRFEVLDPLTGRQDYETAALRGTEAARTAKLKKVGRREVTREQRAEFMANVHGRTSATRTVYQPGRSDADSVLDAVAAKAREAFQRGPEARARAAYFDALTGLRNKAGFKLTEQARAGAPGVVVALTSTDVKPLNKVSHDQTDRLFQAIAPVLKALDAEAARAGTNFLLRAESREAVAQAVAAWQQHAPGVRDVRFVVGDGADTDVALADLGDRVETGRAKGRAAEGQTAEFFDAELAAEYSGESALPASREGTGLDLSESAPLRSPTAFGETKAIERSVPDSETAAATARFPDAGAFGAEEYFDDMSGGLVLNKRGFEAAGPKKWVAALDGIGLKKLNDLHTRFAVTNLGLSRREAQRFGHRMGNVMLNLISRTAQELGGMGVAFARLSGDEYAAKHDDRATLEQFIDDLFAELEGAAVDLELDDGSTVTITAGLRAQVGEESYERAEKEGEIREGGRRSGASANARADVLGERTRRADARGIRQAADLGLRIRPEEAPGGNAAGTDEVKRLGSSDGSIPFGYAELPAVGRATAQAFKIFLNKKATASTPAHELAHVWMAMLRELVHGGATGRTAQTLELARKALGATGGNLTDALTVEQEEQFARAFEVYLREGKAPKAELESVFARFRAWLLDIYRTLSGRMREDLNDELRTVFDRLLATEDELVRWKQAHGPDLFTSAEEAGMSEQQWNEYQADLREAEAKAANQALASVLRERLAETQATIDEKVRGWEREYSNAWEKLPLREAWKWLEEGFDAGDGEKHRIALDRAAVRELVGEAGVRRLPTVDDGSGTMPDELAQGFGYDSGGRFLAELLSFPQKDTWVGREVAARQVEEIPGALDERQRLRDALEKAMAPQREKQILEGWRAMRGRAPAGVPQTPPLDAINRRAKNIVDNTQLRSVIPARALASERRAAAEAARAGVVGKAVAAMEAMQRQLLSAAVHREQLAALKERDSFLEYASQLARDSMRREAGKARPTYRDAIDYIVSALQLPDAERVRPEALERGLMAIDAAARQMESDGQTLGEWASYEQGEVPGARLRAILGEAGEWRGLRVAEMRIVREALEQLRAAVRARNEVLLGDRKVAREAVKEAILSELRANPRVATPATKSAQTPVENLAQWGNAAVGFLTNPSDAVRKLTADNRESVLWQAFVEPMQLAKHKEADLLKSMVKPVTEAFEKLPRQARERMMENLEGELFVGHTDAFGAPRKRFELLMMALNMGNAGNKQRLLDGRRISEAQVLTALERLTSEELDWVQSVWDSLESMRDAVFALEESDSGLRPEAVRATPLQVRLSDGSVKELKGGYFPAVYEKAASSTGERQVAESLAEMFDRSYTRAGTPHSHTKQRADQVSAVISLEPNTIYRHFAQVAHDLAFRPVVKSVGSLLLEPEIELELKQRLGEGRAAEFKLWAQDVGSMRGVAPNVALDAISTALRRNLAPAALGYSVPTALSDFANPLAAVASTDLKLKYLAAGTREYMKAPLESRAAALAKSGELRFMQETLTRDFARQVRSLTDSQHAVMRGGRALRDNAFIFMEAVQVVTSTPVWLGAYQQGLEAARAKGLTSDEAIQSHAVSFADDVLRQTWPNHSPVDSSRLLRDRGYWGMTAVFFGYLNVAFRSQVRLFEKKRIGALVGFWIAYSALGELFAGRGPDDGDRDDEEPDRKELQWRNWFMRKLLAGPFGSVPVLADAYAGAEAILGGHRPNPRLTPVAGAIDGLARNAPRALDGDAEAAERVEAGYRALAPFVGAPTRPIGQAKYVHDWLTGELEPQSPIDVLGGAVYGQRDGQPLNVFTGGQALSE